MSWMRVAAWVNLLRRTLRWSNPILEVRRGLTAESGGRRIDQPGDWVAEEIGIALRRGTAIIPVLVDGARMPNRDELPPALADLANRQAMRIAHESFAADSARLIQTIEGPTVGLSKILTFAALISRPQLPRGDVSGKSTSFEEVMFAAESTSTRGTCRTRRVHHLLLTGLGEASAAADAVASDPRRRSVRLATFKMIGGRVGFRRVANGWF